MLVINTAFKIANLGISIGEKKVFKSLDANCKHSENTLKTIDEMLKEIDAKIQDIDTVAVVVGPGSFTGIRIGISIAKAFMCANENLKCIKITSLEYIAKCFVKSEHFLEPFYVILNALSGNYFIQKFDNIGISLDEIKMIDTKELESLKGQVVVGLNGEKIAPVEIEVDSQTLLEIAEDKLFLSDFISENELLPLYIRPSQAEVNLKEKHDSENK